MEFIAPDRQKEWGWPAIANFALGGMGAGYYLVALLLRLDPGAPPGGDGLYKLLAPALVGAGFLALTLEAGRPARGIYLLSRLGRSWMSRETLAGIVFMAAALLEWRFPGGALLLLSAFSAAAFLLCQAFVLVRARAVAAWEGPLLPGVVFSSALASGAGLMLLVMTGEGTAGSALLLWSLALGGIDLLFWEAYLRSAGSSEFLQATRPLRRTAFRLFVSGFGRVLPLLLIAAVWVAGPQGGMRAVFLLIGGLGLMAGSVLQKIALLRKAAYQRGIACRLEGDAAGHFMPQNSTAKDPNR